MKGRVRWFDSVKGYGFIEREDSGGERVSNAWDDVFVHFSAIQAEGLKTLSEGETVTFEIVEGARGPEASNVIRGSIEDPAEKEPDIPDEEFVALGLFGNTIRLVSLTRDGAYRFLDGFEKLHNIVYVVSSETAAFKAAIDELEDMVNNPKSKENDFQAFFERNPDFVLTDDYKKLHPRVMLIRDDGETLVPDFVLEPVSRSDLADLLELKLPSAPIYVMKKNRPRFSAGVAEASAQLREYSTFFDEEKNRKVVQENYGLLCYKPKMFVIIGRKGNVNALEVRRIHSDMPNMYLRTYDDIICRMKSRLKAMKDGLSTV